MKYLIFYLFCTTLMAATHNPQEFLNSVRHEPDEGLKIVKEFCATCHAKNPLIELGAPKMNQLSDWEFRMKRGLDSLFQHTAEGFGAMPARGGCFECSDEQLSLAIAAMLPQESTKPIKKAESRK